MLKVKNLVVSLVVLVGLVGCEKAPKEAVETSVPVPEYIIMEGKSVTGNRISATECRHDTIKCADGSSISRQLELDCNFPMCVVGSK